jgi:carbamoyltransferase
MRILGIHDGHNCTACLYLDGKIVAMVAEERFSRNKNQSGFPKLAVEWLVKEYGLTPENVDLVAVAGLVTPMQEFGQQIGPWYRLASSLGKVLPARLMMSNALVKPYLALRRMTGGSRPQQIASNLAWLGIPESKIKLVEHHTCHAHAAYWLDDRRSDEPTLVITLDNTGDGRCGSVSIARGPMQFERLTSYQSLHSIGMMYTAVTRYLGMKAVEDEYKVMGLAPYARGKKSEKVYEILRGHMDLSPDGLEIVNKTGLWEDAYVQRFQRELAGFRFDHVAAGVQKLVEDLVLGFLQAWVKKTGIRKLALGGGVFMNVKLNMLIEESKDFGEVYFLPSCGDDSIAAGAALKSAWDLHMAAGKRFDPEPLGTLYLGPGFTNDDAAAVLDAYTGKLKWKRSADLARSTAELLAKGMVVGRMHGRTEFGARALGNRSILARADSLNQVRKINSAIKMRDFWMPFAASLLWERRRDYLLDNGKDSRAPYMILGFRTTPRAVKELIAGLHPFDLSCRPQLVEADWNPAYHAMLKHYERITGFGGVLNTSFNLHGDPVVCTPRDAIETYIHSDLDVLTIEDYLVWDEARLAKYGDELVGTELACAEPHGAWQRADGYAVQA